MILRHLFVFLLALSPAAAKPTPPAPPAEPFPQEQTDLKPDPAAKFGRLPNGFRYVILPNHEPQGRASLRLLIRAGSLDEADDERGLAHFLEHMAFNGSKNYPPGTLVEFFQRMGMSFGGDTNASTTFERTVYQLELAQADEHALREGLRVFGDYAGGLLLGPEEIEKERGVILAEKRASDSVGYRTFLAEFQAMLSDTRFPARIPIGDPEIITHAPRERFLEFWNAHYRPDRLTAIVVGDFKNAADVERMVRAAFSGLTARSSARPAINRGTLPSFEGIRPFYHHEDESPSTNISFTVIAPYQPRPDTAAYRRERVPRWVALQMLNRRFTILAQKEGAPFLSAGAGVSEPFDFFRSARLDLTCKAEQWSDALALGEQELRRALEHGFTASELKEAVANSRNALEQAVKTSPTRRSAARANELVQDLEDGDVTITPAAELAILAPALDRLTPESCAAALRADFTGPARFLGVTGNATLREGDPAAAIRAAYEQANAVPVERPPAEDGLAWAYTDFGPPGRVAHREHIADLDLDLVTFENGVRLNLKRTDFEANRIALVARLGSGAITEPPTARGLSIFTGRTFLPGALGKHSADDLRALFAGRNVGWQFAPDSDAFRFAGSTTPRDLLLQFQFLAAELTDPGYRDEAARVARKAFEQTYLSFQHTAAGPVALQLSTLLASGDPRFGWPPLETMLSRSLEESRAWLAPNLAHGALEIALSGDVDLEVAIDAAARTVGALPAREPRPALEELKHITFPNETFARDYTVDSEIPKGALLLYWPTDDGLDIHRNRRLTLLAAILSDRLRLKVREEIGATYSPNASSAASDTFPGYGYLQAAVDVDPAAAPKMAELVITLADDLAKNGVTPDELDRARQPLLTAIRESQRTNGYWVSAVLSRAGEKPEVLDWARSRLADIESINPDELSQFAAKYLGRAHASRATILPIEKPAM